MDFLCYHRDRTGSMPLRQALLEAHWSYMDTFAKELIARGPTFDDAGEACTGSVHIVALPDVAAARSFAFDEPNYQAGVYRDVLLRRWHNTLGRTMWDYAGGREGGNRYLVLGFGEGEPADLSAPAGDDLIAYGPLFADDGTTWVGTAALVRAADASTAAAVLRSPDRYADIEVHNWSFGGRPTT
ncbi:YciI family protein [Streptomyces sp. NPDC048330]|uniref:YciI family protein n=1 Tax=Streptomyces sp. NPDC048330 TaxID=3365533 RepID=UPI003717A46E